MKPKTRIYLLAAAVLATLVVSAIGYAAAHDPSLFPMGRDRAARGGFTESDGTVDGRYVTFTTDPATGTLRDLTLKGDNSTTLLLASLRMSLTDGASPAGSVQAERCKGGYLLEDGHGNRVMVRDAPGAGIQLASANGTTLTLALPQDAQVTPHEAVDAWSPAGATITYADGKKANLALSKGATLTVENNTLTVTVPAGGHAGFHVQGANQDYALHPGGPHHGPRGGPRGHHGRMR